MIVSPTLITPSPLVSAYALPFTSAILGVGVNGVTVGSSTPGSVGSLLSDTSLTGAPLGVLPVAVAVLVT